MNLSRFVSRIDGRASAGPALLVPVLLALTLLALSFMACAGPEILPVPIPENLPQMDPPVQQQFHDLKAELEKASNRKDRSRAQGKLGQWFHAYQMLRSATVAYGNARQLDPDEIRWPYYLGVVHQRLGELETARAYFDEVFLLDANHLTSLVRRAEIDLSEGRIEEAVVLFDRALEVDAQGLRALVGRAAAAREQEDLDLALQMLENAADAAPDTTPIRYELGITYLKAGQAERGRAYLAMVKSALDEEDPKGTTLSMEDPFTEEIAELNIGALRFMREARKAAQRGRFGEAERSFRRAIEINGDLVNGYIGLGRALMGQNRPEEAREVYLQAIDRFPADPKVHLALASWHMRRDENSSAEDAFRHCLEADPTFLPCRRNMAKVLEAVGAWEEAQEHLRFAQEAEPSHLPTTLSLARSWIRHGFETEARDLLEESQRRGDQEIQQLLAVLLASASSAEVRNGPRALELALELFRSSPDLENVDLAVMAAAASGRLAEAARCQEDLVRLASDAGRDDLVGALREKASSYRRGQAWRKPLGAVSIEAAIFVEPSSEACRSILSAR